MRPVEHFIIAFLPAVAIAVSVDRHLPPLRFVGVVFVASQFPDLVDKPLAHYFGVIPSGRVFMHSLPIAFPFLLLVLWYGWWTQQSRLSVAFVGAHLSHLLADNYHALRGPPPSIPTDLLWPITDAAPRPAVPYWAGPNSINLFLWTAFSATVLTVCVWFLIGDVRTQFAE